MCVERWINSAPFAFAASHDTSNRRRSPRHYHHDLGVRFCSSKIWDVLDGPPHVHFRALLVRRNLHSSTGTVGVSAGPGEVERVPRAARSVLESPHISAPARGWIAIAYTGILSTAVAFSLQAIGQRHVPSSNAAIILSNESLFACLGGALLLHDRLPPAGYVGAALIFVAIVLIEGVPAFAAQQPKLWNRIGLFSGKENDDR